MTVIIKYTKYTFLIQKLNSRSEIPINVHENTIISDVIQMTVATLFTQKHENSLILGSNWTFKLWYYILYVWIIRSSCGRLTTATSNRARTKVLLIKLQRNLLTWLAEPCADTQIVRSGFTGPSRLREGQLGWLVHTSRSVGALANLTQFDPPVFTRTLVYTAQAKFRYPLQRNSVL